VDAIYVAGEEPIGKSSGRLEKSSRGRKQFD